MLYAPLSNRLRNRLHGFQLPLPREKELGAVVRTSGGLS
jgi:hypothetical protein